MDTSAIRTKTSAIVSDLLTQSPTEEDKSNLKAFQILHNAYLSGIDSQKKGIEWDKVEALPAECQVDYFALDKNIPREETINLLKKLCLVKINGGLGTTMGCTGPKGVIEVRNGQNFLDITVTQLKAITKEYGVVVPLVLMNSFSTQVDTENALKKYSNDKDVKILTFLQHKFPRIDADTLLPVTTHLNGRKEEWYPPGHGDFLQSFVDSAAFKELEKGGIEYVYLSNVDNLGATLDTSILSYFYKNDMDFSVELTPKTLNDVKGGTLIKYEQKLKLLEIAQVPKEKIEEFQDIKKFKVFNTNNIWMKMASVKSVVEKETLLNNMDIIVNRKMDGERKVIQLEIAVGCAISAFEKTSAVIVPRRRFLPVKSCSDLFVVQSTVFNLDKMGHIVDGARKVDEMPPPIKLSKEYQHVGDYAARLKHIPNIEELKKLDVEGDVLFGEGVVLKGEITIKNATGKQVVVEHKTLENETITF
ncbi:UTP--glucose-1-phosphate uridylyltransferase, putative [Entamoeba invadens IP1]|uniref:UTP--glucose-1-phosphate uridylyltransferase n=1 Tax=Entamoeba invadens IP1 TaxID=370355 RepID=A0A0A1TVV2_ENTIV|nr:UTP--glucose-1-phosphate uridylyltransferase, putative [Entamoeba invadens IP1]ELP84617.1 UTP--glucose-1-phosphate uridylyltransferase, putative [Entamoeba invadens IP1]|eukprot:XP_004183963.1 UTP--glucose-1-phosphate uridylyltransferase, putative [Entamoeba invadens IP1]